VNAGNFFLSSRFSSTSARKASTVKSITIGGLLGTTAREAGTAGDPARPLNQDEASYSEGTPAMAPPPPAGSQRAANGASTLLGSA
jgi:hypothetical protein